MGKINVIVTRKLGEEHLRQISAVSPQIAVQDVSDLIEAEKRGDDNSILNLNAALADTEVIYGFAPPRNILTRAPKLKWIHTMLAGVESILDADIVRSPVILTNGRGIHDTPCAEAALMMMLMLAKNAPRYFLDKQEKKWQKLPGKLLQSKTAGIVGLGSIGNEIARLCKSFRMRVIGIRRNVPDTKRTRYVDAVLPVRQLHQMLAESDFVIMALPYTPETDKLMGEKELSKMKPTAFLVNIGRGRTVDEAALIWALENNQIAGAGMDTFATEPLPPDSKLWKLPNVIISPHVAGGGEDTGARGTEQFCENLKRYLDKKRLINVVDKKRGY